MTEQGWHTQEEHDQELRRVVFTEDTLDLDGTWLDVAGEEEEQLDKQKQSPEAKAAEAGPSQTKDDDEVLDTSAYLGNRTKIITQLKAEDTPHHQIFPEINKNVIPPPGFRDKIASLLRAGASEGVVVGGPNSEVGREGEGATQTPHFPFHVAGAGQERAGESDCTRDKDERKTAASERAPASEAKDHKQVVVGGGEVGRCESDGTLVQTPKGGSGNTSGVTHKSEGSDGVVDLYERMLDEAGVNGELERYNMREVHTLKLCSNRLEVLPERVRMATYLRVLDVYAKEDRPQLGSLERLPEWISELTGLQTLNLCKNRSLGMTLGEASMGGMASLTSLDLTDIRLKECPLWLGELTGLQTLNLRQNCDLGITLGEASMGGMASLTSLDLTDICLKECPLWLGELTGLQTLNLSSRSHKQSRHRQFVDWIICFRWGLESDYGSLGVTLGKACVGRLTSLTSLDLSGIGLEECPLWLGELTGLQTLNLELNFKLGKTLGKARLGRLTSLTSLDLSYIGLEECPLWLGELTALQTLNLGWNFKLGKTLGEARLGRLSSLTSLDLCLIELEECPLWLGELTGLQALNLRWNCLRWELFKRAANDFVWTDRRGLGFQRELLIAAEQEPVVAAQFGCLCCFISPCVLPILCLISPCVCVGLCGFCGFHSVLESRMYGRPSSWCVWSCMRKSLGKTLGKAFAGRRTSLTSLDLSFTRLKECPLWLGELTGLQTLNLSINRKLGKTLGKARLGRLTRLTSLDLSYIGLEECPLWLGELTGLQALNLCQNRKLGRTRGEARLGRLTSLTSLDLSYIGLEECPLWLGELAGLQTLDLSMNYKLGRTLVEARLGRLTNLTRLDLSYMQLEECPLWLGELTGLQMLDFGPYVQKLRTPPPFVVENGAVAVVQYMRDLAKGSVACHMLKMMLLGDPRAGKSSLLDTMASGKPTLRPDNDRTVSVDVRTLRIHKDSRLVFNAYDAGGHEVYKATHRFFMSPGALYVLVVDISKGEPSEQSKQAVKWMEAVHSQAQDAAVVVLGTHVDKIEVGADSGSSERLCSVISARLSGIDTRLKRWEDARLKQLQQVLREAEGELISSLQSGARINVWKDWREQRNRLLSARIASRGDRVMDPKLAKVYKDPKCGHFNATEIEDQMSKSMTRAKQSGLVQGELTIRELQDKMREFESEHLHSASSSVLDKVERLRTLIESGPRVLQCTAASFSDSALGVDCLKHALESLGGDADIFRGIGGHRPLNYLMLQHLFAQAQAAPSDEDTSSPENEDQSSIRRHTDKHCTSELRQLCARPFVSMSALSDEACKCGMTRDEVHRALEFLHATGSVLYYGKSARDEKLRSVIFTRPQWIIDAIKYIIHERTDIELNDEMRQLHGELDSDGRDQLTALQKRGRLCSRLLRSQLWKHLSDAEQDALVSLMGAFRLIHETQGESGGCFCQICAKSDHVSFVVPAMFQDALDMGYVEPSVWTPERGRGCQAVMRREYRCSRLEDAFLSELQVVWCSTQSITGQGGERLGFRVLAQAANGMVLKCNESVDVEETAVVSVVREWDVEAGEGFGESVLRVVGWVHIQDGVECARTRWPLFNSMIQKIYDLEQGIPGLSLRERVPFAIRAMDDEKGEFVVGMTKNGLNKTKVLNLEDGSKVLTRDLLPTEKTIGQSAPEAYSLPVASTASAAAGHGSSSQGQGSSRGAWTKSQEDTKGQAGSEANRAKKEDVPRAEGYEIVRLLGGGAQGKVWLATLGGERVAVKVCREGDDVRREYTNMSDAEAHPNLVRVRCMVAGGVVVGGDTCAGIVMEYIEGESLRERLERPGGGGLHGKVVEACRLMAGVLSGLAALHGMDPATVHRDVKPANIMLRSGGGGEAVLLDFGVSKRFGVDEQSLTGEGGGMKGTPLYAAPEVVMHKRGADVDVRADVWSCGVVLYEMVAGARPYVSDNLVGLADDIRYKEMPPLPNFGRGRQALDSVLRVALCKDREGRFADAGAMLEVVQRVMQRPGDVPRELHSYSQTSRSKAAGAIGAQSRMSSTPSGSEGLGRVGRWRVVFFGCRVGTDIDPEKEAQKLMNLFDKERPRFCFTNYPRPEIHYFSKELEDVLKALEGLSGEDYLLILHFSGHADKEGGLYWYSPEGKRVKERQVTGRQLAGLIRVADKDSAGRLLGRIDLIFLNACCTLAAGLQLHRLGVRTVVCWAKKVTDGTATEFVKRFYLVVRNKAGNYSSAFETACLQMGAQLRDARPCLLHGGFAEMWDGAELVAVPDDMLKAKEEEGAGDRGEGGGGGLQGGAGFDQEEDEDEGEFKNWRVPGELPSGKRIDRWKDFAALAGEAEREALRRLRFSLELDGKPIGVGNGLDDKGFLSAAVLDVLGVDKYSSLWGPDGHAVAKAKLLVSPAAVQEGGWSGDESDEWEAITADILAAAAFLLESVTHRTDDSKKRKKRGAIRLKCKSDCKCARCRHEHMSRLIAETATELQVLTGFLSRTAIEQDADPERNWLNTKALSSKAGKEEQECLRSLGFPLTLRGSEIKEGNGIYDRHYEVESQRGMHTPEAMDAITKEFQGKYTYTDLWGVAGLVKQKAQKLVDASKQTALPKIQAASKHLANSIEYREQDMKRWEVSDGFDEAKHKSHEYMLNRMKGARDALDRAARDANQLPSIPGMDESEAQSASKKKGRKKKKKKKPAAASGEQGGDSESD